MIWIVLFIVSVVGLVLSIIADREGLVITFGLVGVVALVLTLAFVGGGVSAYPRLLGKKEAITTLQNEIETIREARYGEVESGVLVGGSLDNMKQSTALSNYLIEYVAQKAKFNKILKEYQIEIDIPTYWWLSYAAFMDKRIKDIESLK